MVRDGSMDDYWLEMWLGFELRSDGSTCSIFNGHVAAFLLGRSTVHASSLQTSRWPVKPWSWWPKGRWNWWENESAGSSGYLSNVIDIEWHRNVKNVNEHPIHFGLFDSFWPIPRWQKKHKKLSAYVRGSSPLQIVTTRKMWVFKCYQLNLTTPTTPIFLNHQD